MTKGRLRALATGSAVGLAMTVGAGSAHALNYTFGELELFIDTTLSAGVQVRTAETDKRFLSSANFGPQENTSDTVNSLSTTGASLAYSGLPDQAFSSFDTEANGPTYSGSINADDGRLNFDQWDLTSGNIKMTNDIQANWRGLTVFARVNSFYDAVLGSNQSYDRSGITDGAKWDVAHNINLLDLYASYDFEPIEDIYMNVRLGKQVISWGESTFLLNGINVINPLDVTAFRRPGAEVKEGLLPTWAAYTNIGLPFDLSLEAFYLFTFDEIQLDRPGTPFSTSDNVRVGSQFTGNEGGRSYLVGSSTAGTLSRVNCIQPNAISANFQAAYGAFLAANPNDPAATKISQKTCPNAIPTSFGGAGTDVNSAFQLNYNTPYQQGQNERLQSFYTETGQVIRTGDNFARDNGQFGVALRWYSQDLGGTEFGFYFMNYHSRLPMASERLIIDQSDTTSVSALLSGEDGTSARLNYLNSCQFPALFGSFNLYGTPIALGQAGSAAFNAALPGTSISAADPDKAAYLNQSGQDKFGTTAAARAVAVSMYGNPASPLNTVFNSYAGLVSGGAAPTFLLPTNPVVAHVMATGQIAGVNLGNNNPLMNGFGIDDGDGDGNFIVQANSGIEADIINCALVAAQSGFIDTDGDGAGDSFAPTDGTEIIASTNSVNGPGAIELFLEYPEDIKLYGFSFNTTVGDWGVQGEMAYRVNQPFNLNGDQLTIGALNSLCVFDGLSGVNFATAVFDARNTQGFGNRCGQFSDGEHVVKGWTRGEALTFDIGTTATYTASHPVINGLGADLGILLTEVGGIYVDDVPSFLGPGAQARYTSELNAAGGGAAMPQQWAGVCTAAGTNLPLAGALGLSARNVDGCRPTKFSMGYVLVGQLQYNNAFGTAWQLAPSISFSHDFLGNSPAPLTNYRSDTMSISLGVNATLQNNLSWGINYVNNFGIGIKSGTVDQDYLAFNIRYGF